ncbi:retrovirus-related pol polyprotein from transposon TNT 1-94, partial [Tanacetum coccineum]
MTTLADNEILLGADNHPPMLENDMYDSWKSIMELYMMSRQHERMILESIENGPLIWPTIEENRVTRPKKYSELSATEAIQADCDIKATNIILQGLPPEVYALVRNHKVAKELWERIQLLMQGTSLTKQERYNQSSTPLSITYPSNDYQSSVYHNAYSAPSSIPQIEYASTVNQQQQHEFPSLDLGLTVLVFKQGDDPIDAFNHMMPFQSAVVTSRYPTTNNQLRNTSNPSQQATINDGRITLQPVQGRQFSFASGTSKTYTPGASRSNFGKQRTVISKANGQILHEEELAFLVDPGIAKGQATQTVITHNHDKVNHNMINQAVQAILSSEQSNVVNHSETEITSDSNIIPYFQYVIESQQAAVQNSNSSAQQDALILYVTKQLKTQVVNYTKINLNNKSVNDTLTAELERYKEQVKVLKEGQNVDLKSKDNVSDSCAQFVKIDHLKRTLSEHLKEKESLMQTVTLLKNDFKKEESRNIDREIALEKRIKQLDNIQALGFQNPFYLKKAQQLEQKLYDGNVIEKTNAIVIPDSEETLMLAEERCQIGNITISRVYYVEGLGHNLFSVGQFCDSNLEVAFRQHTCFICNLEGVDLLTGSQGNNLYTLSLGDMMASSPICLLSKASKTKSWLWHRCLSHLNFSAINHLARQGLVWGLPKLKFEKDHLCSACAMGKSKKKPHIPKSEDTNKEKLYLLHMDLCGPMRVTSVNRKKYILVIVDDYSRFTWVKCLMTKDEALDCIIKFLKMIQKVGISHETYVAHSPQQNGVVERHNRTLIEAACTMLIYAKAPLFLWAEVVATTCYTQNRSIRHFCHGKTPYELLYDKLPNLSFFYVFGALCYPINDSENLGKLQPKADIGIFISYAPKKKAFQIYNRRTRQIIETIHVAFDELTAIASEHSSLGPTLHEITPATISLGLVSNPPPSTSFVPPSRTDWDLLFQPLFDELLNPPSSVDCLTPEVIALIAEVVAPEPAASIDSPSSTTVDQDAPSPSNLQTTPKTQSSVIPNDVEEDNHELDVAHMNNDP